jgi:pyruvate kinase
METLHQAPNGQLSEFKRTKIIATVGPATNSYEAILGLIKAGANGLRFNFSYGTHKEFEQQIVWIRKASLEYGKPVAIIQDIQGPKIRLGDFDGFINVQSGQSLRFRYKADYEREGVIPTQYDLSTKVKRGERIYLFDGKVHTVVTSVKDDIVHVRAEKDGLLLPRTGINLPDTDFAGDILSKKDMRDIVFGANNDIDYVALSFVQSVSDIQALRRILKNQGSEAKIIAKIETKAATNAETLEDIVRASDAVMIARGDLAVETELESIPVLQRKIVGLGIKYSRPTIVATQMLASMSENPEPTRAEVSDVATAVFIGSDCVMLSNETATGKYPVESVETMKRVIRYTESNSPLKVIYNDEPTDANTKQGAISSAVIGLAHQMSAVAIVAETKSGATALKIASRRPHLPIITVTSNNHVAQQLAISYGTKSFVRKDEPYQAVHLADWLKQHRILASGDIIVTASGQHPGVIGTTDTIKVRVIE